MNQHLPIYLDGFATMPLAPEVKEALLDAWSQPGNSKSPHIAGERSAHLISKGRSSLARLINAAPSELAFTSGATEANRLAFQCASKEIEKTNRKRIVVSAIEHRSVYNAAAALKCMGVSLNIAPVDSNGRLDVNAFERMLGPDVLLASVMAVNNETGVIQPISEAISIAHSNGVLFHCDAAQAVGKIPIDVVELNPDFMSISAHKLYGPIGVGALYVAAGICETSLQSIDAIQGSEPAPLIAGFGVAAEIAREGLAKGINAAANLALQLREQLKAKQVNFRIITGDHPVVPGSIAIQISGIDADLLCATLGKTVCVSTGSACHSGQIQKSHVLHAMRFSVTDSSETVRILCNRYNNSAEINKAAQLIADAVGRVRLSLDALTSSV